ncbi:MAG TPA: DUF5668 domain-containing protein [Candidatus Acidoferrum sp.]|nr:DUF5668 domain-containing protein [Candidatus Acidoferrum sp.]
MSDRARCTCRRCTIRGLMGPAIITTIGILFLLGEFSGGWLSFWNTFPVILIVIGAILLASSLSPMDGHIDPSAAPGVPPPPAPPANPYQGPQGQGQ